MDIKDFINQKLEDIALKSDYEQREAKFTVTLSAEHKFMLEEVASLLEQSLTSLAGEILEQATDEIAFNLALSDLEKIVPSVEKKTIDFYKKIYTKYEHSGSVTKWPYLLQVTKEQGVKK